MSDSCAPSFRLLPPGGDGSDAAVLDRLSDEELDALPFGAVQLDAAGMIRRCNAAGGQLFGSLSERPIGRALFEDMAPATDMPDFRGRFQRGLERGRLDERFDFDFDVGVAAVPVRARVEMMSSAEDGRYWIVIRPVENLPRPGTPEARAVVRAKLDPADRGRSIDAARCESEPIHVPGAIQPHGALLALDPADLTVVACSANVGLRLGIAPGVLLGRRLDALAPEAAVQRLRAALEAGELDGAQPLRTSVKLPGREASFRVTAHLHDGRLLVELETAGPWAHDLSACALDRMRRAVVRMRDAHSLDDLAGTAVRAVRALTGFERVLLYRFAEDGHGVVVAEDKAADWDQSFLGLHFPASDIPRRARELYARSPERYVPHRDYTPIPLVAAAGSERPVDLTYARLRSLSPMHLEYHRCMGVDGSMSLSVLNHGRLWGLVVGHHRKPHFVAPDVRAAAEMLAATLSMRLDEVAGAELWRERQAELRTHTRLLERMAGVDDFRAALVEGPTTLADLFGSGGAAIVAGGEARTVGRAPPPEAVAALAEGLRRRVGAESDVVATASLAAVLPGFEAHAATASGVLALYLDPERRDALLWFRPEAPETVVWGGNPDEPYRVGEDPARALPRRSFERWVEERRGRAEPWAEWHVELARSLGSAIREVILRHRRRVAELDARLRRIEELNAAQRRIQADLARALAEKEELLRQKDLLFNEAHHRIKNGLQFVSSLLKLQEGDVADPATRGQLAEAQARVLAIAEIHGRLHRTERLESVEFGSYLRGLCADLERTVHTEGGAPRLAVAAAERELPTDAAIALALVANELVTNALKYAYPQGSGGAVHVRFGPDARGRLRLEVADDGVGLPPGFDPARSRGLGMRIVTALAGQLGADIEVGSGRPGARFAVVLPD